MMISAYPIGTYSISDSAALLPIVNGSAVLTLSISNATILTTARSIVGTVTLTPTVTGTISSANVLNTELPILVSLVSSGTLTSPNIVRGSVSLSLSAVGTIGSANTLSSSLPITLTVNGTLSSSVNLTGTVLLNNITVGSIVNPALLSALDYNVVGLNTTTAGHFVYSNYPFNSIFKVGDTYYATSSNGVFSLTGILETDWIVKSAQTNMGSPQVKNIPDIYVDMRNAADVVLTLTNDDVVRREGYTISSDDAAGLHRRRVKTHKGLRGNNWQVEVSGENFAEIKQVDCRVAEFKRSIY